MFPENEVYKMSIESNVRLKELERRVDSLEALLEATVRMFSKQESIPPAVVRQNRKPVPAPVVNSSSFL